MSKILFFTIIGFGWSITSSTAQESHRHDFVAKGDDPKDLKMGDYVVVARTVSEADAVKFIGDLKKMGLPIPSYGYQSNQGFWLIYFDGNDDIEKAKERRDELRKHDMFKSAWLLTVHQSAEKTYEHPIRHEFMKRGQSRNDLALGTYVIAGAFQSEKNAKRVVKGYQDLDFKEVEYGFQSEKKLWYVVVSEHLNIDSATESLKKYQTMKMFRDSWLLTIHQ